jgi:nucleoside-diphosphate-sugar epimerase
MQRRVKLSQASVAVTGATGFLGGYLVDRLRARGAHVVAVVRDLEKARGLAARGAEVRRAELADRRALARAFRDVQAVISNAAVIAFMRPRETLRTNVEGTRNVFEAMAEAGVERAIAISSTAAYRQSLNCLNEGAQLRRGKPTARFAAYAESKAAAERLAWELCGRRGIALTTFRPCGITGPGDPLLMRAVERFMRIKLVPFPAFTEIGVVHAADVAEAVCVALERPEVAAGKAYNLQGNTVSLWAIADAWRRAGGRSPWLRLPIPVPYRLRFDDALARRELGFQPRGLAEICQEAVAARN